MKKIIYFDTWTQGISNYQYIDKSLNKKYQTLLLHVESKIVPYFVSHIDASWYKAEKEQTISGILCRDVSAYGRMNILEIIKKEAPDVVIMLAPSHIQNRIATVACKRLGIPIVYMMHGALRNHHDSRLMINDLVKANRYKFLTKLKKIPKFLKLLSEYQAASGNIHDTLNLARQLFTSPFTFSWDPESHYSLEVDQALVYADFDIITVSEVFKIPVSRITAVGNPKCDYYLSLPVTEKNERQLSRLLYIEEFLTDWGIFSDDAQAELLAFLKAVAQRNNLEFIIRLHPGTNRKRFLHKFGTGYDFVQPEENITDSLMQAKIVTGHFSTALQESIVSRTPTICMLWYEGVMSSSVVGNDDVGIVRDKALFEEKLREFNTKGWMQEATRKKLFPKGEVMASQNIVSEIETLMS